MNCLAIDTSGKNLTVILFDNGKTYSYFDGECGVKHSEDLMPAIENILIKNNFDLANADFIACVVGAGSFTGIRIGVSTAKALCFAYGKKCLPVTSFDVLAYNIEGGKVLSVIDAGHDGFYVCGYENKKIVISPKYILKEELIELEKEFTLVSESEIKGFNVKTVSLLEGFISAVKELKNNATLDIEALTPLYLRKSQAEEGR